MKFELVLVGLKMREMMREVRKEKKKGEGCGGMLPGGDAFR